MRKSLLAALLIVACGTICAWAVQPGEVLSDPRLEARARALSAQLRCMVCQNQSIDDSDASLAHDIRVLIRERLAAGQSDSEVKSFLVSRYGEFILLEPRFELSTLALWGAPPLVLLLGAVFLVTAVRRRANVSPEALSAAEEARVAALLKEERR